MDRKIEDMETLQAKGKRYDLPFALWFKSISPTPMERYALTVLPNGLPVCQVTFINRKTGETKECTALVDTGAEFTCVDPSIFDSLNIDESDLSEAHISGFDRESHTIKGKVNVRLPSENWGSTFVIIAKWDLDHRKEYKAIIGMDLMRNFRLVYDGIQRTAWLES
jgi:hypothetical protein